MAVLTSQQRAEVSKEFQSDLSAARTACAGVTKADVVAMLNALDDYFNTNAATINSAIPLPARNLPAAVKAQAAVYVIRKRWIVGA